MLETFFVFFVGCVYVGGVAGVFMAYERTRTFNSRLGRIMNGLSWPTHVTIFLVARIIENGIKSDKEQANESNS